MEKTNKKLKAEDKNEFLLGLAFVASMIYTGSVLGELRDQSRLIPNEKYEEAQIQQGYVAPSKIQIKLEDSDRNGQLETVVKIGNEKYSLMDVNGKPVLFNYKTAR